MNAKEMAEKTFAYIESGDASEEAFNEQALTLFTYQFRNNPAYQKFCRQKGKTLRTVKHWTDIPSVPVDAFKQLPLTSTPIEEAVAVFMTSGSTSGVPGKHYHATLDVYNTSMKIHFKKHVMREMDTIRMIILYPTAEEMPNSSLAHYLDLAKKEFGSTGSAYCFDENGIQYDKLFSILTEAEEENEPVLLLGASYSYVHLFRERKKRNQTFTLPEGSMIFDTGGYKNQSEELELDDFYHRLESSFGVPRKNCVNMYGMTELSTQFYDVGNEQVPSLKYGPHWIRTRAVDPLTSEDKPHGEKGVFIHYDLANINSVPAIMTEDVGYKEGNGFYLLGRAEGAEAKGCSLALDSFVQATKGDL